MSSVPGIPLVVVLVGTGVATVLAVAVRRSLLHWTRVTSHSMLPTLRPGQWRLTLRARDIGRLAHGDVVVLRSDEIGIDVVKRVIGLPGDRVRIAGDGALEVNGTAVEEPYVTFHGGPGGRFHVPPDQVLVLGDNRLASTDSRHWRNPYLPAQALRGRLVRCARTTVSHPPGSDQARRRVLEGVQS